MLFHEELEIISTILYIGVFQLYYLVSCAINGYIRLSYIISMLSTTL